MVVDDFHFEGVTVAPAETNAPLIVYANAVLPLPVPAEGFKAVARGHAKILNRTGSMQVQQLSSRRSFNAGKSPYWDVFK